MVIDSLQKYTYSVKECVNMKKEYVTPTMAGERFSADEYVAACITGTIQCRYPGDPNQYDDWTSGNHKIYTDNEGQEHGICGDDATISFNGSTATGFEFVNGKAVTGRPISEISGYKEAAGTYYVTWTSEDKVNNTGTYHHKGRLIVSSVDSKHPNHS